MQQAGQRPQERQQAVPMDLSVTVQDPLWLDLLAESGDSAGGQAAMERLISDAAAAVLAATPLPADLAGRGCEVSVVLTDDARMQEMNRTWRGIDKPTDVLSFPGDDGFAPPDMPVPLGDIVLARQTMLRDAALLHRDLPHHLSHIAVHGLLHLLGWDHEVAAEAEEMEAQERLVLRELGFDDDHEEDGGSGRMA